MGRDRLVRPVRPPAGHRTGPVRSFGSGGHRTGVGPVEQAVQPDEPTGSIDFFFFFKQHQNDVVLMLLASK